MRHTASSFFCITLTVAAAALAGCDSEHGDLCARAAAHVASCTGTTPSLGESCDATSAQQLLGLDCAALQAASAQPDVQLDSLTLNGIACAAGIVRDCPQSACTAPVYPGPSTTCSDYIGIAGCGGCQFYACREAEHACGPSGYYLGYAEKYCVRFLQSLRPRMSPAGQRFLDKARDCLMDFVDQQLPVADACDDVKSRAFQSHVACYDDNGFCSIPLADRWLLVNTIDPADFQLAEAIEAGLGCL